MPVRGAPKGVTQGRQPKYPSSRRSMCPAGCADVPLSSAPRQPSPPLGSVRALRGAARRRGRPLLESPGAVSVALGAGEPRAVPVGRGGARRRRSCASWLFCGAGLLTRVSRCQGWFTEQRRRSGATLGSCRRQGHEGAAAALAPVMRAPKGVARGRRAGIPVAAPRECAPAGAPTCRSRLPRPSPPLGSARAARGARAPRAAEGRPA
eukprot:COSAG04_NODE_881_length_9663_cov_30.524258_13_plen_207_part_01